MISSRAVLISSSLRQSRPACRPGSPFCSAPRSISPLGSPCLGSFLVLSFRPVHLVISSCSRVISIAIPSGLAPIHGGEGSDNGRWQRAVFFFSCAVFLSSLSFASSLGSPRRGVGSFPFPTVAASAWVPHHLIRSVHLIRPHCPIISSHHGTEALVPLSFKQATTA